MQFSDKEKYLNPVAIRVRKEHDCSRQCEKKNWGKFFKKDKWGPIYSKCRKHCSDDDPNPLKTTLFDPEFQHDWEYPTANIIEEYNNRAWKSKKEMEKLEKEGARIERSVLTPEEEKRVVIDAVKKQELNEKFREAVDARVRKGEDLISVLTSEVVDMLSAMKFGARKKKVRRGSPKSPKSLRNPWMAAVNATRRRHPEMSLKEAMVYTKRTYKKNRQ